MKKTINGKISYQYPEYYKNYYQKNKEKISKQGKIYYNKNKITIGKRNKKYRQEHIDKWEKYRKTYDLEHKEHKKEYDKIYRQTHQQIIKKRRTISKIRNRKRKREYNKIKYHTDIIFRLSESLRKRLYKVVTRKSKFTSAIILVGCSIKELKQHLQSQFKPRMTWKNYGKWHIDHIKPCAKFNLSKKSEQRKCFNYKNLQPLWAKENLEKHAHV